MIKSIGCDVVSSQVICKPHAFYTWFWLSDNNFVFANSKVLKWEWSE